MKNTQKKDRGPLTLNIETLVHLDQEALTNVMGGARAKATGTGDSCDGCTHISECDRKKF
jgi:hypothetical protein